MIGNKRMVPTLTFPISTGISFLYLTEATTINFPQATIKFIIIIFIAYEKAKKRIILWFIKSDDVYQMAQITYLNRQ